LFKEIVDGRVDKDITTEHPHRISMPMSMTDFPQSSIVVKINGDKETK
jgi:hypothetical protein